MKPVLKIIAFAKTDIGMKRRVNQDAFLKDDKLGLFVVADGMGGHLGGEVASQLAVTTLQDYCTRHPDLPGPDLLHQAINAASEAIFLRAQEESELHGMGTTVIVLLFRGGVVYIGQVGDSRAYLLREGEIWQLTEDHSLVNEELRAGRLSPSEVANHQFRNVITRSVGYERSVAVDVYRREVQSGDLFLTCTDGLSGLVTIEEILEKVSAEGPEKALSSLIDLVNARGGDDNVTILACQVETA